MVEVCPQAAFGKSVQGRQLLPASKFWRGGGKRMRCCGGSAEMYWKEKCFLP